MITLANTFCPAASSTIGVLTAIVTLIYAISQLYLEWATYKPSRFGIKSLNLYVWSLCHFPFHLALMLLIEGTVQLLVWLKLMELISYLSDEFYATFLATRGNSGTSITRSIVNNLNGTVNSVWELYHPEHFATFLRAEALLAVIGMTPESFWTTVPGNIEADSMYQNVTRALRSLQLTVLNSVLVNFKIEEIDGGGWPDDPSTYKGHALEDVSDKFSLVVSLASSSYLRLLEFFNTVYLHAIVHLRILRRWRSLDFHYDTSPPLPLRSATSSPPPLRVAPWLQNPQVSGCHYRQHHPWYWSHATGKHV